MKTLGLILLMIAAQSTSSKQLAVVNGEAITEEQVTKAAAADLQKLEAQRPRPATYDRDKLQIMWKALDAIVEDKLIAAEAVRNQVTKERLLEIEVESNVEIPSTEEAEAFYQANKAQIPLAHDEAIPRV